MPVRIEGCRVLVTGAARGLGHVLAESLLARGARTVYAGARDPDRVTTPGVVPVRLDITSAGDVAAAAARCSDVDILINNAGLMRFTPVLTAPDMDSARAEMETNYFGTLRMCRAFAPVLAANGGGALVNVLRVQVRRVVADQRRPDRTAASGHAGHGRIRGCHRHRDGCRVQPPAQDRSAERRRPDPRCHRGRSGGGALRRPNPLGQGSAA